MTYIVCHFCGGYGCNMCRTSAVPPTYAVPSQAPLSVLDRQTIDALSRALNNLAEALRETQFAAPPNSRRKKKPPA